jgi:beta-glucuronidase
MLIPAACCVALVVGLILANSSPGGARPQQRLTMTPPAGLLRELQTPPPAITLSAGWRLRMDPRRIGLSDGWYRTGSTTRASWTPVSIPDDFNPKVTRTSDRGTVGWYADTFTAPPQTVDRTYELHFGQVLRVADVWLNGRYLGRNTYGYAPFNMAASGLNAGGRNTLVVRVDTTIQPVTFPQDWWNWGGIVQPVRLVPVGRVQLSDLGVMPQLSCDYTCGELLVQGVATNHAKVALAPRIIVRTVSPEGFDLTFMHSLPALAAGASEDVSFKVPVHGPPDLWAPGNPALYDVTVQTVAGARSEQTDTMQVGMRSVRVSHGVLYLNGKRLWLHGASIHEDVDGRGAALTSQDIRTIVTELQSVGANITRAHYLLNADLLDALDRAGILVWEQATIDHADAKLVPLPGRLEALQMLRATVLGGRSHPSVIVNSIGNELTPTPETMLGTLAYLKDAIPLVRRLDPAAAVGLDTYCYTDYPAQAIYRKVDVLGISSYFGWYTGQPGHLITKFAQLQPFLELSHRRYPKQALVVAEFGAEGEFEGAADVKGSYTFQSDYIAKTFGVLDSDPFMNGGIYWTLREFAVSPGWVGGVKLPPGDVPTGIHHKGLISYTGAQKPAFAAAQAAFADPPRFVR